MVASVGVGYTGFKDWTLAADLRYIDYAKRRRLPPVGFAPDGMAAGSAGATSSPCRSVRSTR